MYALKSAYMHVCLCACMLNCLSAYGYDSSAGEGHTARSDPAGRGLAQREIGSLRVESGVLYTIGSDPEGAHRGMNFKLNIFANSRPYSKQLVKIP